MMKKLWVRVLVLMALALMVMAFAPAQTGEGGAAITPEQLAEYVGVVLSLVFAYVPGLNEWYGKQTGMAKRQLMLGLGVVVAGGILALGCGGIAIPGVPVAACSQAGVTGFVNLLFAYAVANQAAFLVATPGKAS